MKVGAIMPAAGAGRRLGGIRKAFMEIAGKPMLLHSIDVFLAYPQISCVVVPVSPDDFDSIPEWLKRKGVSFVHGGAERADSVRAGLNAMPDDVEAIIVHDAARPLLTRDMIDRVLAPLQAGKSATIAVRVTDTLHEVDHDGSIRATPDRSHYWRAQTPQAFPRKVLETAFATALDGYTATDEAGLVAAGGWPVVVVEGEARNIKVTHPEDIAIVESMLRERGR
jgi:2-C-methyl-D-erythritol 4-phosphate cytidylyltransferase